MICCLQNHSICMHVLLALSTTCFRPVADNVSRSIVLHLDGEPLARRPGRCCSSKPCLRHFLIEDLFPIQTRCPSCRFLSDHGQLVVLEGVAAVDFVFDIATLTTCFRPVPDNVSMLFVPLIIGKQSARRPKRCCSSRPRLRPGLVQDLFPTQIRCPSRRFLSGHGQLVVLDGAAALDLVFDIAASTTCFRAVPDNVSRSVS